MAMEADHMASMFTGTQDYGLDLDLLQEEVAGNVDFGVRFADNQTPPPKTNGKKSEFQELVAKKERRRSEELPLGYYGKVGRVNAGRRGLQT